METTFDVTVLGDECSEAKPSPIPYLIGMQKLHVDNAPHQCIVFEDSIPGVIAGHKAGAIVVGVLTGQTDEVLRNAGATYCIHDYTQIDVEKLVKEMKNFVNTKILREKESRHTATSRSGVSVSLSISPSSALFIFQTWTKVSSTSPDCLIVVHTRP